MAVCLYFFSTWVCIYVQSMYNIQPCAREKNSESQTRPPLRACVCGRNRPWPKFVACPLFFNA